MYHTNGNLRGARHFHLTQEKGRKYVDDELAKANGFYQKQPSKKLVTASDDWEERDYATKSVPIKYDEKLCGIGYAVKIADVRNET